MTKETLNNEVIRNEGERIYMAGATKRVVDEEARDKFSDRERFFRPREINEVSGRRTFSHPEGEINNRTRTSE